MGGLKKFKKAGVGLAGLGIGLGVGAAVAGQASAGTPAAGIGAGFGTIASGAAIAVPVIAGGIVLGEVKKLNKGHKYKVPKGLKKSFSRRKVGITSVKNLY